MGFESFDVPAVTALPDIFVIQDSDVQRPDPGIGDAEYKTLLPTSRSTGLCADMSPLLHALMAPAYQTVQNDMAMGTKHKQACGGQCRGACSKPVSRQACRLTMLDKVSVL